MKRKSVGTKVAAVVLAAVCLMAAGCGNQGGAAQKEPNQKEEQQGQTENGENGTYQNTYEGSVFAQNSYHPGYMGALCGEGGTYTLTLKLENGSYTLTKEIAGPAMQEGDEHNREIALKFAFSGEYTMEGEDCKLSKPTKCEWSEEWADLATMADFVNGSGTAESATDATENGDVVFDLFNGKYLSLSAGGASDMIVGLGDGEILFD